MCSNPVSQKTFMRTRIPNDRTNTETGSIGQASNLERRMLVRQPGL
ncbi:hypothetical protein QUB78_06535 [Microcoleus sp. ARI1-A4]